jgi:hypothetical protein
MNTKLTPVIEEKTKKLTVSIDIYNDDYVAFRFSTFKGAREEINKVLKMYEKEEQKNKKHYKF